jgi:prepilin-type N-terminal cleavage/methylation domain-containing protein
MRNAGFTLVEVILAIFLMGLALMYAAPLFIGSVKETAAGADLGSVGARAVDRMERLRQTDFYGLSAGGSLTSDIASYSDTSEAAYTVRWQIVDNGSPATLKTINVRVIAARTSNGTQKEVTLATTRAR